MPGGDLSAGRPIPHNGGNGILQRLNAGQRQGCGRGPETAIFLRQRRDADAVTVGKVGVPAKLGRMMDTSNGAVPTEIGEPMSPSGVTAAPPGPLPKEIGEPSTVLVAVLITETVLPMILAR